MCQTLYWACEQKHRLKPMEYNLKECSIDPNFTYAKLLGQKKEELDGFLRFKSL